jgi:glycosyltransferase involved in cell wall biosynthesis
MHIDLYAACWNEERIIPFFLRHYEPLVDRIVIFDDGSNDRSLELLSASRKVELRRLPSGPSSILMQMEEMNRCWKESRGRADWVIICDVDEHIYHPQLRDYLKECKNAHATILHPIGMEMVSASFPPANTVLSEIIRHGVRSFLHDKMAVFDPNAIEEINYTPGLHVAAPTGRVIFSRKREVKLLHYKQLGLDYVLWRSNELRCRQTDYDRERGWSLHNYRSAGEIKRDFTTLLGGAQDISLMRKRPATPQPAGDQRRL